MGKSGRGQQSLATSAEAVSDSVVCVEGWTSARSCIRSRYLNYERPWRKADRPDPSHQLSQITKRTAKHAFWALTIPSNLICDCLLQTSLSDLENETSAVTKLVQRSERNKNGEGVSRFHPIWAVVGGPGTFKSKSPQIPIPFPIPQRRS